MVERKLVNWAKCSLSIFLRCEAQRKALVTLVASFLPVESIGVQEQAFSRVLSLKPWRNKNGNAASDLPSRLHPTHSCGIIGR